MSSSVMSSQSVILTTAVAISGAVVFLSLARFKNLPFNHQNSPPNNITTSCLRSCLSSDDKRGEKKKKKKRVKFADNVKDHNNNKSKIIINDIKNKDKNVEIFECEKIPEFNQMPANRIALYHGILRDRVHRIECSY